MKTDIRQEQKGVPRISVVLSFRNPGTGLQAALLSLLWQEEQDWELIAIDDGSTDGSAGLPLLQADERIHLVRHAESAGLAARLNEAIGLARGGYIARMDADDVAFPQRFRQQAEFLDAHPEIDLLASAALMIDGQDRPTGVLPTFCSHVELTRRPWSGFAMPHPTWMGRRSWFMSHPYDPRARKAQDMLLLYQTFRYSRFAALAQPLLAYRYPALSASKTLVSRYYTLRAVWKHDGWLEFLGALVTHGSAAVRDLLAIAIRQEHIVIRRRTQPATAEVLDDWTVLLDRLRLFRSGS